LRHGVIVAVTEAPTGNEITEDRSDSKGDAQGLIRMLTHGLTSGFGTLVPMK
jgi:hypothetical protein